MTERRVRQPLIIRAPEALVSQSQKRKSSDGESENVNLYYMDIYRFKYVCRHKYDLCTYTYADVIENMHSYILIYMNM
jgi:hypothetical protein